MQNICLGKELHGLVYHLRQGLSYHLQQFLLSATIFAIRLWQTGLNDAELCYVNNLYITTSVVLWLSVLKGRSRKHRTGRTYRGCFVSEEIRPAGYHSGKGEERHASGWDFLIFLKI